MMYSALDVDDHHRHQEANDSDSDEHLDKKVKELEESITQNQTIVLEKLDTIKSDLIKHIDESLEEKTKELGAKLKTTSTTSLPSLGNEKKESETKALPPAPNFKVEQQNQNTSDSKKDKKKWF